MIRLAALAIFLATSVSANAADQAKFNADKGKSIAEGVCVACHGADGNSPTPANPILAGQIPEYIVKQLGEFKSAKRNNPIMLGMSAALSEDDMKNVAAWFARQKQKPAKATDEKLVAAGQKLWRQGDFSKGVPACAGCHGPTGAGIPAQFPRLAGQYAEYTELQLKSFRAEDRSNDPDSMMRDIAAKLSDKQIKALADYIAGLR